MQGVEFVVGSLPCCERFSPGIPQKPTFPNSNLIWNAGTHLNEFLRTPECFEGKQIPDYVFKNNII